MVLLGLIEYVDEYSSGGGYDWGAILTLTSANFDNISQENANLDNFSHKSAILDNFPLMKFFHYFYQLGKK